MSVEWHNSEPSDLEGVLTGSRRYVRTVFGLLLQVEYNTYDGGMDRWTTAWRYATANDVVPEDVVDLSADRG